MNRLFVFITLTFISFIAAAQDETRISGQMLSETGMHLQGGSVILKNTRSGTVTDANGNFSINTTSASEVLVFSFIGYLPVETNVSGRSTLTVALVPSTRLMDQVIVIGYCFATTKARS